MIIYLDMDGVLANFDKEFPQDTFSHQMFTHEVMNNNLFGRLEMMPNAYELLSDLHYIVKSYDVRIRCEILSSLGSPYDKEMQEEVAKQKSQWIDKHISKKLARNFVVHRCIKYKFATPNALLIDDHIDNILHFEDYHGYGVLYDDNMYDDSINQIKEKVEIIANNIKRSIYS